MIFTEKIFTLMNDCRILTRETINFLNDKDACNRYFNCKMNPHGGIIRHTSLTMCDSVNPRYYCPLSELKFESDIKTAKERGFGTASCLKIIFEGEVYYISNDWFSPGKPRPTKKLFYDWFRKMSKKFEESLPEE